MEEEMGKLIILLGIATICLMSLVTGYIILSFIKDKVIIPLCRMLLKFSIDDAAGELEKFRNIVNVNELNNIVIDGRKKISEIEKEINGLIARTNLDPPCSYKEISRYNFKFEEIRKTIKKYCEEPEIFFQKREKNAS